MKVNRRKAYRERHRRAGLCERCCAHRVNARHCLAHREMHKVYCYNSYWRKKLFGAKA